MNLEKLENLLHACLAFSFAVGLLVVVVVPPASAEAAAAPSLQGDACG